MSSFTLNILSHHFLTYLNPIKAIDSLEPELKASTSTFFLFIYGVLQGSLLDPKLYLLTTPNTAIGTFADDTSQLSLESVRTVYWPKTISPGLPTIHNIGIGTFDHNSGIIASHETLR